MTTIRIGISGWTFDGWRGTFYPDRLRGKDELAFASRKVGSIEINGTFHSLFRPANYQSWYEQTPAGFVFAVKAPKYITHERRLKDFETPLSNFLASGILALGEKLGPILWQFPPTLPFTAERFAPFMAALPHDMKTAAHLGTGHSTWLEGRTFLEPRENRPLRHAIEGRHESFRSPEFIELARRHGIAVVVGDTAGRWPCIEDVTTSFIYIRLHGDETKYPDGYTKAALEHWAERLQIWAAGRQPADAQTVVSLPPPAEPRQVFAFFDNDVKELAAVNALSMISHLCELGALTPLSDAGLPAVAAEKKGGAPAVRGKKIAAKTRPAARTAKKPAARTAKKPAARTAKKPAARTAKKPAARTAKKPAARASKRSA
jgi:uncharacterized protein YecE (DUF72 family)